MQKIYLKDRKHSEIADVNSVSLKEIRKIDNLIKSAIVTSIGYSYSRFKMCSLSEQKDSSWRLEIDNLQSSFLEAAVFINKIKNLTKQTENNIS